MTPKDPPPRPRCPWAGEHPLYVAYHDTEWGVAVYEDVKLFEFLILEGAQAGLSWITVLKKRAAYRRAFSGFDPQVVAGYDTGKIANLLTDTGIIRNRAKIISAVQNAGAFVAVQEQFGGFAEYIWRFVDHRPRVNRWHRLDQVPAHTPESKAMAHDLKKRGFSFVGPTICYAFMQAVGMVNDHLVTCFRHAQIVAGH